MPEYGLGVTQVAFVRPTQEIRLRCPARGWLQPQSFACA